MRKDKPGAPMGEIVNLRRARKAKKRAEKEKTADANRSAHGRTKSERAAAEADRARTVRTLDGARRDCTKPSSTDD